MIVLCLYPTPDGLSLTLHAFQTLPEVQKICIDSLMLKPVHRRQKQRNIFHFSFQKFHVFQSLIFSDTAANIAMDSFSHLELCRALGSEIVKLPRDISKSQQGALAFKGITTLFPLIDRHILSISVSTGEMEMNKHKIEGTKYKHSFSHYNCLFPLSTDNVQQWTDTIVDFFICHPYFWDQIVDSFVLLMLMCTLKFFKHK